jgi:hypothetical protein
LIVSALASNPDLLPAAGVVFGGGGASRSLRLQPATGRSGTSLITLTVADEGGRSAAVHFVLMVVPAPGTLFCETFDYANGSLVTNSAGFWRTHSGTTGQVQVLNAEGRVSSSQSEDVHALFPDGAVSNGVLYARFDATFTSLPSSAGEYFAHWNGSSFRGRIFARNENAAAGAFRLAIANGSANVVEVPMDLNLNTSCVVVLRYEVETASSTLWVNPSSESSGGVTASDSAASVPISAFGLRQASGAGTVQVDNLKVARTFGEVVGQSDAAALNIVQTPSGVEIWWPHSAAGYRLEGSTSLRPGEWADVVEVPVASGDRMVVQPAGTPEVRFFRLVR